MGALFGRERRQWAAEPVVPPMPGVDVFGAPSLSVTPERALVVPTVWACVQLLANAVAMLPLCTYRRTADIPARITDPQVVLTPDPDLGQPEWLHQLMVSLLLRGNAFALVTSLDGLMRPSSLVLLNPDKLHAKTDTSTGKITYTLAGKDVTRQVWHVRGMTMPGEKMGLSPIRYAAQAIGIDLSSRKFAKDFFDGGGVPKAVLQSDMEINQEQARTVKERLMAATRNREPAVFGSGVKYQQISVNPEESQFLETQAANISEIARVFGVPPEMVGGKVGSSMTYSNVEQRSTDFLTFSLQMWLRRIEDAISSLLPQPQYVQFDTSHLLRTDAETQAKVDAIRVASKVLPPSRLLKRMDEPPLTQTEKEELELVPLTVTPMGLPKALPNPATPETSDDTPEVNPPKLGVVANG